MKKVTTLISLILGLAGIVSLGYAIDSRYAQAIEVASLERRLEQKIQSDRSNAIQERIWSIEDRLGNEGAIMNSPMKDEYRRLKQEYNDIGKEQR